MTTKLKETSQMPTTTTAEIEVQATQKIEIHTYGEDTATNFQHSDQQDYHQRKNLTKQK